MSDETEGPISQVPEKRISYLVLRIEDEHGDFEIRTHFEDGVSTVLVIEDEDGNRVEIPISILTRALAAIASQEQVIRQEEARVQALRYQRNIPQMGMATQQFQSGKLF